MKVYVGICMYLMDWVRVTEVSHRHPFFSQLCDVHLSKTTDPVTNT